MQNSQQFFKVDIHTHILPREIPNWKAEFGYGGFIQLEHHKDNYARMVLDDGTFFRDVFHNLWDPEQRISEMDENGVNLQILSTVPVMFSYWAKPKDTAIVSRYLNEDISQTVSRYPSRFIGLGTLPMNDTELALEELDYCIRDLKLNGIEIGTHIPTSDDNINLHDDRIYPIFKRAEELGAAIFVHPWDMPWRPEPFWAGWLHGMTAETSKTISDLIFSQVFRRLRDLRFVFAHSGGSFCGLIGRIEHGFNVRPDLFPHREENPRDYLDHFWVDTLTADPAVLRYNMSVINPRKFILGSDFPFPLGEAHPGMMVEQMDELDNETKKAILGKNAFDWLGLDINEYTV